MTISKRPKVRESSPPGFSTFITFAPNSDKIKVAKGPDNTFVKSSTTTSRVTYLNFSNKILEILI